jgi:hypothetical protein
MESAVPDDFCEIQFSDWQALTPARRNALTWVFVRRAHAARSRAIGEAVLGTMAGLFGRPTPPFASAGAPASARR